MKDTSKIPRLRGLARSLGITLVVLSLVQVYLKVLAYFPSKVVRVAGLKLLGSHIGPNVLVYYGLNVLNPWSLNIGKDSNLGFHVTLDGRGGLRIGESCNISSEAAIWTGAHDLDSPEFVNTVA